VKSVPGEFGSGVSMS